jgi:hypothetical protein
VNLFEESIENIRQETGWTPADSSRAGGVRFELADGPDLELFAPDGRQLFMQAALPGPGENPEEAAETMARLAAGAALTRASILSFSGRGFSLHRALDLKGSGPDGILAALQAFLNDWDWWRSNTGVVRL